MKLILKIVIVSLFFFGCKSVNTSLKNTANVVEIDLVNIEKDKVAVNFFTQPINTEKTVYYMPKTVPGTYSIDNYGKYVSDFKAYKKNGDTLPVNQIDENSWEISNATKLYKIEYLVDDTYDSEFGKDEDTIVFSPAGTNILNDENFVLNLHGFIGYFKNSQNKPYQLSVKHSKELSAATSHHFTQKNDNKVDNIIDNYYYTRYAQVTDDPIIYGKLDNVTFKLNDIEVLLSVYSPNRVHLAEDLLPSMKKMMTAQKEFMGDINGTKKYSILLYLSTLAIDDAQGFGALEHNNSTVVVLPEMMPLESLEETMIDVVSHEFFHIIAPLTIHSEEIHNFDYYDPKMSQHLWMYEGTTEYFANLFQVTEKIINVDAFYKRMLDKIRNSSNYNDEMSFTKMSTNILEEPYKSNYINVYEKGALISMCLDIIIRENSNGEKGMLDLMKALSKKYGAEQPFKDDELINVITELTYPEVGAFLNKHVVGSTPIDYNAFFKRVGLVFGEENIPSDYFIFEDTPYLSPNQQENNIYFNNYNVYNSFLKELKVEADDILISINNQKFDLNNASHLFEMTKEWKPGMAITMLIERGGIELLTKTTIKENLPTISRKGLISISKENLTEQQLNTRKSWLHQN